MPEITDLVASRPLRHAPTPPRPQFAGGYRKGLINDLRRRAATAIMVVVVGLISGCTFLGVGDVQPTPYLFAR